MRLFIVDDSAISRRMLRRVLGELSWLVIVGEATSGEEALARVGDAQPDVVVMDWQMPGINGVEATTRLLVNHPHVRVVGYTSSGEPGAHQAFLDAGAVAVFRKEQALDLRDWLSTRVVGGATDAAASTQSEGAEVGGTAAGCSPHTPIEATVGPQSGP
jgi:CheY-like chemotaxis protein